MEGKLMIAMGVLSVISVLIYVHYLMVEIRRRKRQWMKDKLKEKELLDKYEQETRMWEANFKNSK